MVEEGYQSSVSGLYETVKNGDIIDVNIAKLGKWTVRPEELVMKQLHKGFTVDLDPVLKKNISDSQPILNELVDNGAKRVKNARVVCPCFEKCIKLRTNGKLNNLLDHLTRRALKDPQYSELLSKLQSLMK